MSTPPGSPTGATDVVGAIKVVEVGTVVTAAAVVDDEAPTVVVVAAGTAVPVVSRVVVACPAAHAATKRTIKNPAGIFTTRKR